jgi:hypothetical protein
MKFTGTAIAVPATTDGACVRTAASLDSGWCLQRKVAMFVVHLSLKVRYPTVEPYVYATYFLGDL